MTREFTPTRSAFALFIVAGMLSGCKSTDKEPPPTDSTKTDTPVKVKFLSQPLISAIYTADPSAHVFNGKIYIYPSHDYEAGIRQDDLGSHFAMKAYHIL